MMCRRGPSVRAACALVGAALHAHLPLTGAALPDNQYGPHKFPDDPSVVIVESSRQEADDHQRLLQTNNSKCKDNESLWVFDLFTDRYPWETSWKLFDSSGVKLASGPPGISNYERETSYVGAMCLTPGRYRLRMFDDQGDGMCCEYGDGSFKVSIDGKAAVQSDDADYKRKDYYFRVPPRSTPSPPPPPTPRPTQRRPTPNPTTLKPSGQQQAPDAEPEVAVSFIMMGDTPYEIGHRYCLNEQLRALDPATMEHPYKFLIHVGDIMEDEGGACRPEQYSDVAEIFAHESNRLHYDTRDVFFVIGDNEWRDCNNRDAALTNWMNNFGNGQKTNGRNTGPNPYGYGTFSNAYLRRTLEYDDRGENEIGGAYPSSASNFAFFHNRVLFVGINMPGGRQMGDEAQRVGNNLQWVKTTMAKYKGRMKSVVIFAHAAMGWWDEEGPRWEYFGRPFEQLLRDSYPDIFVLYAHGDWHEYWVARPDKANANLVDLSCDSGENAEPILVSITRDPDGGRDGMIIDRRGGMYVGRCDRGNREKTWSSSTF